MKNMARKRFVQKYPLTTVWVLYGTTRFVDVLYSTLSGNPTTIPYHFPDPTGLALSIGFGMEMGAAIAPHTERYLDRRHRVKSATHQ